MKIDPRRLRLYAVTDRAWARDTEHLMEQVAAAIDGGAGLVQLREKHLDEAAFLAEAERFVALCREKGAVSIINDNVDIARKTGADGVHVGQEDLAAGRVRELLGPDKLIGVSAHSVEEALAAQAAGADYLGGGGGLCHRHPRPTPRPSRERPSGPSPRRWTSRWWPSAASAPGTSWSWRTAAWTAWQWSPPSLPSRTCGRRRRSSGPSPTGSPGNRRSRGGSGAPPSAALENFNAILSDRKEASI